jgi:hypothetical protein
LAKAPFALLIVDVIAVPFMGRMNKNKALLALAKLTDLG